MWAAVCRNRDCTELDLLKRPLGDDEPVPEQVRCGACQQPCEVLEQPVERPS